MNLAALALGSPFAHDTFPVATRERIYRRQQDRKGTQENSSFLLLSLPSMQVYNFDRTVGGGLSGRASGVPRLNYVEFFLSS